MRRQKGRGIKLAASDLLNAADEEQRETLANARHQGPPEGGDGRSSWISPTVIRGTMRTVETALIALSGLALWVAYVDDFSRQSLIYYLPLIAIGAIAVPALFELGGLYTIHALLRGVEQLARVMLGWLTFFAVVTATVFLTKIGVAYSRVWLVAWFVAGLVALTAVRIAASALIKRWNTDGRLDRRAVIVGGGEPAARVIEALRASPDTDITIIGLFDDRNDDRSPPVVAGFPKLGKIDQLVDFARKTRIDLLIVTLPVAAEDRLLEICRKLWVLPVDIRLSAYTQKLRFRPRAYSYIGNIPFLDVFDKPLSGWDHVVKIVEDKVIAALLVILAAPVMAAVALAVKLESRGPILFKQKRYGFNNELIEVYKFRSMYVDQADQAASRLVTRNDPRVTRVGRIIRKTSLDELPQLFNVLKGDLSLVGPRPHATQAKAAERLYTEVVDGYFARHKVKPGITGWAQINGWRGETDTEEKIERRVEHDLYYIENWSVLFDLYILVRTPFSLLSTKNAY